MRVESLNGSSAIEPPEPSAGLGKWVAAGLALIAAAVVVASQVAMDQPSSNLITSVPTTLAPPPQVFDHGVDEIPMLWNEAADNLNLDHFLLEQPGPNRLEMNLLRGLTLYATEQPASGQVRTLMIRATPTTSAEQGEAVLASWGILLSMLNPELDGPGRGDVLDQLGVDPGRPLTSGLDTNATVGHVTYRLRSGVLGGMALLTASLDE